MRKLIAFFLLTVLGTVVYAQTEGVFFEELTYQEALMKAEKEKKYVFMDCYTSWCGPCKYMAEHVFTTKEAGDFFNPRFVSVKYDMEKGEGIELGKRFGVYAYPTFLILSPEGEVLYRIVGGGRWDLFCAKIKRSLEKKNTLPYLAKRYQKGKISSSELMNYWIALRDARDNEPLQQEIRSELEKQLKKKERLQALYWPLWVDKDYGTPDFYFVLNNLERLKTNVGEKPVENYIVREFSKKINQCKVGRGNAAGEILQRIREELNQVDFSSKDSVLQNLQFAEACVEGDLDQVLSLIEEQYLSVEKNQLWSVLSPITDWGIQQASKEQLERVLALEEKLMAQQADDNLKHSLQLFFEQIKIKTHEGVYFYDLSFEEALKKAKEENRRLFIDCYTSWCGPCMYMANVVFKEKALGDFMNARFLCVKYDLEVGNGPQIQQKYGVSAYPTFIILNPDGSLLHQFVGGGKAEEFIGKVKRAFDKDKALGMLKQRYEQGERGKDFLVNYLNALVDIYSSDAKIVANEIFQQLTEEERVAPEYWFICGNTMLAPYKSDIERYVLDNRHIYERTIGKGQVESRLLNGMIQPALMVLLAAEKEGKDIDMETLTLSGKDLSRLNLKDIHVYRTYVEMAKARKVGDMDKLISICEKNYTSAFNKRILYNLRLKFKNARQQERWSQFIKRISE